MSNAVERWFAQATYDLETAKALLRSKRYIYAVFMCHLSLEKALKGLVVAATGKPPPRTHNLIYLSKLSETRLSNEQITFLATINTANIVTRYPEDLEAAVKQYNRKMVRNYVQMTEKVMKCLHQDPRLQK